ncbi:hypothetical protein FHW67_002532 [Herbaspirillum sp. Sphag1AN]|uniref:hypothetical protein n=1 Tax=unclassified Herbaspirillum TaxID=2624150 RepID=UPI00160DF56D|nr:MULTISPECIES: hypothetical protein [unclassified Herbaspirillum]MBB3213243.1 hypothetical protein [Herbaspirillum sp. Sphag1AN]MBB3246440.1 hypothetical protein [Herbaspirillum sp. Sphag64]
MAWSHNLAYFFGAAFLANAIPHFVSGTMGRAFQSPFAKPSGIGLSSAKVNVLWGGANLVIAYLLLVRVGNFDLHAVDQVLSAGLGFLLMGWIAAHLFGRLHGGDLSGS